MAVNSIVTNPTNVQSAQVELLSSKWTGPFRFLDLPAEMRVSVYQQLLPHDQLISFDYMTRRSPEYVFDRVLLQWVGRVVEEGPKSSGYANTWWKVLSRDRKHPAGKRKPLNVRPGISLFLVNKFVSNEARAVLYGSNTYYLEIDSQSHTPVSLQSPLIFGPLSLPHRLPLLRNLRSITLKVIVEYDSHWVVTRQRARLAHFVDVIKQHADDDNQKSLLKHLTVIFKTKGNVRNVANFMFALESLASLRGIEEVKIRGVVGPTFKKCLELCIKGKGGDVKELEWPLIQVRRRKSTTKKMEKVWVSARKWYHPTLNWKEYAERNGIE